jgi:homoserine kinase
VRALPFPPDLAFVIAQPELELSTRESRGALPREVPMSIAVQFAQNLAAFVHALHANDRALFAATFRDLLAEPHRAPLVRGFRAVQAAARESGALACSLSGSGPAVFAVAERAAVDRVGIAMQRAFASAHVACAIKPCTLDARGARCL